MGISGFLVRGPNRTGDRRIYFRNWTSLGGWWPFRGLSASRRTTITDIAKTTHMVVSYSQEQYSIIYLKIPQNDVGIFSAYVQLDRGREGLCVA